MRSANQLILKLGFCNAWLKADTLEGFVEVEAEVGEDDPQLLPPVGVLELPDGNDGDIERYDDLIMMM